jgi:fructose-bisphosphate aldolase class I
VITIGDGIPTDACLHVNAHALARYAALSQEAGVVPIVEPEVLMDADNTIERCHEVTSRTLHLVFEELDRQGVALEGMLLKPNMVISGKGCPARAAATQIADLTVDCFLRHVPAKVPGIVFLSGGQSEVEATENLMRSTSRRPLAALVLVRPGAAGVCARCLGRRPENVEAGQAAFAHRAHMNALAAAGEWSAEREQPVAV